MIVAQHKGMLISFFLHTRLNFFFIGLASRLETDGIELPRMEENKFEGKSLNVFFGWCKNNFFFLGQNCYVVKVHL